jgi:hypothetical protein
MAEPWQKALVIEATWTVKSRSGRGALRSVGSGWWSGMNGVGIFRNADLSNIRVIVDRDGNVAPPKITDEMVNVAAWEIHKACGCDGVCEPDPEDWNGARAALAAALGGETHNIRKGDDLDD